MRPVHKAFGDFISLRVDKTAVAGRSVGRYNPGLDGFPRSQYASSDSCPRRLRRFFPQSPRILTLSGLAIPLKLSNRDRSVFSETALQHALESCIFLLVLLNPFLLCIYLLELIQKLQLGELAGVLLRASLISTVVFCTFAWAGEIILTDLLHVRLASFMIFGGVVFLIIGIRFVLLGGEALDSLRGETGYSGGAVAMPFMIGPGTVSASMIAGSRSPCFLAAAAIIAALALTSLFVLGFKALHDLIKKRNEQLVERYVDIVGRVSALIIGTVAVEMILQGLETWFEH